MILKPSDKLICVVPSTGSVIDNCTVTESCVIGGNFLANLDIDGEKLLVSVDPSKDIIEAGKYLIFTSKELAKEVVTKVVENNTKILDHLNDAKTDSE